MWRLGVFVGFVSGVLLACSGTDSSAHVPIAPDSPPSAATAGMAAPPDAGASSAPDSTTTQGAGRGGSPSAPTQPAMAGAGSPAVPATAGANAGAAGTPGSAGSQSTDVDAGGAAEPDAGKPADSGPRTLELLAREWMSGPDLGYDTQFIDRQFDLGAGPFAKVTLTFQLESPCFPFEKWTADPPPAGQAFPPKCDRFDRLMYFEIDPAADAAAKPGTQILRAITPYGGPLEKTVDITDFANVHPGAHKLRSFVGTWVDDAGQISGAQGGYFLGVRIHIEPGMPERKALAVIPLWSGWVQPQTSLPELAFELPEGTRRAELAYVVTGHGGGEDPSSACIGAADEFCQRTHHLYVDGVPLTPEGYRSDSFIPWRDDCGELCTMARGHPMMGSYCKENPNRAASSVTAPRANWCPGDDVPPIVAQLPAASATAGMHRARFAIDAIHRDGRWQVALIVYAYAE